MLGSLTLRTVLYIYDDRIIRLQLATLQVYYCDEYIVKLQVKI